MNIHVIFTCYNRADKTEKCILSLLEGNPSIQFHFIVVNDGSTDNTSEVLEAINNHYNCITEIKGDGNLYYSKGMRKGMDWLNASGLSSDYVLLVNDDVDFSPKAIEHLIDESKAKDGAIIVGATHDDEGKFSYGGVKYRKGTIKSDFVTNETPDVLCDTFNANCVLVPWKDYSSCEPMDDYYAHAAGDFDYGFSLKRAGGRIYSSSFFVGKCNRNSIKGTWNDKTLPRRARLKLKESPKGLPLKTYLHFLKKNFGLHKMILRGFTPYLKILFKM